MGLRETWSELDTGLKIVVGLGVAVVGLIVLIPVVVILAAVIGSFVLGMGPGTTAPTASFSAAEYANGTVTLTYESGETIQAENIVVQVGDRSTPWRDDDGELTAGETMTVEMQQSQMIRIIWSGDEETRVIQEIHLDGGPSARSPPSAGPLAVTPA